MTELKKAVSNISLDDEASHQAKVPAGTSFMEQPGAVVLCKSGDYDLGIFTGIFRFAGGRQSAWQVDNKANLQTSLYVGHKDQRGKVGDNPFIGNRTFPTESVGDVNITRTKEEVVWQLCNMQFISRPPYFKVIGEHLGVEFDLTLGGLGETLQWHGPWADLLANGGAGGETPCWVEGSIKVRGKKYVLEEALGTHSFIVNLWDIAEVFRGNPYLWFMCPINESTRLMAFEVPGKRSYRHVTVDGREIPFEDGATSIDELDWWVDPQTGLQVPTRWHVNIRSASGICDMILQGGPRTYYSYMTRTGCTIHYCFFSRANGRFFLADGRNIAIEDVPIYVEWGRTLLPLPSGQE